MGFLLHIALAIAALAAVEEGLGLGGERPLLVLLLAGVPHALAWIDRRFVVLGKFRIAGVFYAAVSWSPPVLFAAAVLLCGWSASVERVLGAAPALIGWPHPAALAALAPFAIYIWLSIDAKARVGDTRSEEIARARRFQLRMFLSAFTPFVLFVLLSWIVGLDRRVRVNIELVAVWGGLFALALIVGAIATLPWLLRRTWDTAPMPAGPTRMLLEGFARGLGFECRELVVWNTGFQMANAAVVGIGRGKLVMFSDLLLAQLPPRELLAVFAHELGHVARHHVVVFVSWSLAFFIGVDLGLAWLVPNDEWIALALLGVAVAGWYLAFGWFSRRTELDADLHSIEATGDTESMVRALELVGSPHTRALRSWRHFSTERRVEFLRRAQADPRIGRALQRKLARLGRIGVVLGVLAIGGEAWTLVRSFDADQVRVALALGDNAAAAQRLRAVAKPEADLVRLTGLANLERYASDSTDDLLRHAEQAQARGSLQLAADLYTLARLRGAPKLDDLIAALEARLRTGSR